MRLAIIAVLAGLSLGAAPDQPLRGELNCPHRENPGRVTCELRVTHEPGSTLVWVDVLVRETAPFVAPLRARVVGKLEGGQAESVQLPIAFVARELGSARLTLDVRAVLCPKPTPSSPRPACTTAIERVHGSLSVGPSQRSD